jgi:hypothetical protein
VKKDFSLHFYFKRFLLCLASKIFPTVWAVSPLSVFHCALVFTCQHHHHIILLILIYNILLLFPLLNKVLKSLNDFFLYF